MTRNLVSAIIFILSASSWAARPLAAKVPVDAAMKVDAIFARWSSIDSPGCAVGIALDGLTVFSRAYGMADLEHDIPNNPGTIFEGGSVSKQFTAAAVVLLALEGKLSLDDDVRKYIPEVPDYGSTLTLQQMMNHTSGLRDWGSVAAISGWGRQTRTHRHAHVLDILGRQSALNFEPGSDYSYSNSGYNLLAVVVNRVSGMSFADFSKKHLFEPLGLTHTAFPREKRVRRSPEFSSATKRRCPSRQPELPRRSSHSKNASGFISTGRPSCERASSFETRHFIGSVAPSSYL